MNSCKTWLVNGFLICLLNIDLGDDFIPMQIVTGAYHTCALSRNNSVKCFGKGAKGELGLGNKDNTGNSWNEMGNSLPYVNLGTDFITTQLTAGYYHTCALSTANKVKCWGGGGGGLGYGDSLNRGDEAGEMGDNLLPVDLSLDFIPFQISAGMWHTCALSTEHKIKCWGSAIVASTTLYAHVGDGPNEMGDNLTEIDLGKDFIPTKIDSSFHATFVCALSANNTVKCWGQNGVGQLGRGDTRNRFWTEINDTSAEIDLGFIGNNSNSSFIPMQITVGSGHVCALSTEHSVKCFGSNEYGQLGYGDQENRGDGPGEMGSNLTEVDLGHDFIPIQIAAQRYHTCALSTNSTLKCWGVNWWGILGHVGNDTGDGPNEMGDNLQTLDLPPVAPNPFIITPMPTANPTTFAPTSVTRNPSFKPTKDPTVKLVTTTVVTTDINADSGAKGIGFGSDMNLIFGIVGGVLVVLVVTG